LHELKSNLDTDAGVYEWSEVEDFVENILKEYGSRRYLSPIIDIAEERFNNGLN
jgi:type I restriction enzyme R subunit